MRELKIVVALILVVVISIQFVPVVRDNPPVISDVVGSPGIKRILKKSCYDCHSNETIWPWYSYIAPFSWRISKDVIEGREELNFSEWNKWKNDHRLLDEILEEIEDEGMPLANYLITHPYAEINDVEYELIKKWIGRTKKNVF